MRAFASITASLVAVAAAFSAPPALPVRAPATRGAVLRMFELPGKPTEPDDLVITSITRSRDSGSGRVRSHPLD